MTASVRVAPPERRTSRHRYGAAGDPGRGEQARAGAPV